MNIFDDFSALLRAASDARQDKEWMKMVERNRGIIVSIDGIKPDGGNETIYLVRDALTGRLLNAENVRESSVERLKEVLSPVIMLEAPVLGTISDAQEAEVLALSELWPQVPHQTCQFHALREASKPGFKEDNKILASMKKDILPKVRDVRKQIGKQIEQGSGAEAKQLEILDTYALGVQTALNRKGKLPFAYAGIEASEDLEDVAMSLERLEKKGDLRKGSKEEIKAFKGNSHAEKHMERADREM
jgi:hypothetical protein